MSTRGVRCRPYEITSTGDIDRGHSSSRVGVRQVQAALPLRQLANVVKESSIAAIAWTIWDGRGDVEKRCTPPFPHSCTIAGQSSPGEFGNDLGDPCFTCRARSEMGPEPSGPGREQ